MAYLKFALPIKGSGGLVECFYLKDVAMFNIPGAVLYLIDISDDDGAIMAVPIWRENASPEAIFKRMRAILRHLGINQFGKGGLICKIKKDTYFKGKQVFYHGDKPKMMNAGIVDISIRGAFGVLPNHNNALRVSVNEENGQPDIGAGVLDVAVFGN
jgi:hypothetical protein